MFSTNFTQDELTETIRAIREALASGEIEGLAGSRLAWNYARIVDSANAELERIAEDFGKGETIDVFVAINNQPKLPEELATISFAESNEWLEACVAFKWPTPRKPLKEEMLPMLVDAFPAEAEQKKWLLKEYRDRLMKNLEQRAFTIIRHLAEAFEQDEKIQNEFKRVEKSLTASLSGELVLASSSRNAEERYARLIECYLDIGYGATREPGLVDDAFVAHLKLHREACLERVATASEEAKKSLLKGDWQNAEMLYFEYEVCIQDEALTKDIAEEIKKSWQERGKEIAGLRGQYESDVRILDAYEFVETASNSEKKAATERVEQLVAQALNHGYTVPDPPTAEEQARRNETEQRSGGKRGRSESKAGQKAQSQSDAKRTSAVGDSPQSSLLLFGGSGLAAILAVGCFFFLNTGDEDKLGLSATGQGGASEGSVGAPTVAGTRLDQSERTRQSPEASAEPSAEDAMRAAAALERADRTGEIMDLLAVLSSAGYTTEGEDRFAELLAEGESLAQGDAAILEKLQRLGERFDSQKRARMDELQTIAAFRLNRAEALLAEALGAEDRKTFSRVSISLRGALDGISEVVDVFDSARARPIQIDMDRISRSLSAKQTRWEEIPIARKRVENASTIEEFYEPLELLNHHEHVSDEEKAAIAAALAARIKDETEYLRELIMPGSSSAWLGLSEPNAYFQTVVSLEEGESLYLRSLLNLAEENRVYVSELKYFEGGSDPKSVREIHLAQPVAIPEKTVAPGQSFVFRAAIFDAEGKAGNARKRYNFLRRPDGKRYGFFCEASRMTPESEYFEKEIKAGIDRIIADGERDEVFRLIDSINSRSDLSASFRGFWKSKLIGFMRLDGWKWGIAMSPSLQKQAEEIDASFPNGVEVNLWLSEDVTTKRLLEAHFEAETGKTPVVEAKAVARALERAMSGRLMPVAYTDAGGETHYMPTIKRGERLWFVNPETGILARYAKGGVLSAYTPLLAFREAGSSPDEILAQVATESGIDVSKTEFAESLPPLFAD